MSRTDELKIRALSCAQRLGHPLKEGDWITPPKIRGKFPAPPYARCPVCNAHGVFFTYLKRHRPEREGALFQQVCRVRLNYTLLFRLLDVNRSRSVLIATNLRAVRLDHSRIALQYCSRYVARFCVSGAVILTLGNRIDSQLCQYCVTYLGMSLALNSTGVVLHPNGELVRENDTVFWDKEVIPPIKASFRSVTFSGLCHNTLV